MKKNGNKLILVSTLVILGTMIMSSCSTVGFSKVELDKAEKKQEIKRLTREGK